MQNNPFLELQIEENIYRLERQLVGIQKKILMWKEVQKRIHHSSLTLVSKKKVEQLRLFPA